MSAPILDEKTVLLHAALDDELDASGLLAFNRRLAEDPGFAADYARMRALRGALQTLPRLQASTDFRARIAAMTAAQEPPPSVRRNTWLGNWHSSALAASLALLLGSGLTFLLLPAAQGPDVVQELVAAHVRGMIAGQPADVASSDRHTVKPWFATRVTQAPQVVDLAADGFALTGGRVDMIDDKPVATLVFQHAKHVISVSEVPGGMARAGAAEKPATVKGYSILTWRMGEPPANETAYIAVSDIAPAELGHLASAFRKAVGEQ